MNIQLNQMHSAAFNYSGLDFSNPPLYYAIVQDICEGVDVNVENNLW